MVSISLSNNALLVRGDMADGIFDWNNRLFFVATMGYSFDDVQGLYIMEQSDDIRTILSETIDYLTEEGIKFELDNSTQKIAQQLDKENAEFQEAKIKGSSGQLKVQFAPSDTFVRHLRPFQSRGLAHLLSVKHAANFSVPGSGKTSIIYAAFAELRRLSQIEKLIVIGPRSSFQPWEDEAKACFADVPRIVRLVGPRLARQRLYFQASEYDVFLCTYQTASNDAADLIKLCTTYKAFVVVDESHNIKRIEGGVWAEAMLRIAPYATRRAILSGTPAPNDYSDLWSQLTFLWPGKQLLGDRAAFKARLENEANLPTIRSTIRPFFFRTKKSDLGLPEPVFHRIKCEPQPIQSSIYQALAVKYLRDIATAPHEREALRQWRKARMVRLTQAASNPALLAKHSAEFNIPPLSSEGASVIQLIDEYPRYEIPTKISRTVALTESLIADQKKVIIWTSFIHNIKMLQELLTNVSTFVVYGAVPRDDSEDVEFNREQQIGHFKQLSGPAVLLANPAACAESVSLHKACRDAIYLDRTFNCGQYMQSLDRIHRIGLSDSEVVTYYILIATRTIDETIDRRLEEKTRDMLKLLEDDLPSGSFDADDFQIGMSQDEEAADFEATIHDLRTHVAI